MIQLPVILSIPHSGFKTPEELKQRVFLTQDQIFDDSDAFTFDIYNLKDKVAEVISTDIARAFVDLNRAVDDRPPQNPDGVVKTLTCYEVPVYRKTMEPGEKLIAELLKKYYEPYHRKIREAVKEQGIVLGLDCHSMAETPPPISPDHGKKRPSICLGNGQGKSCSEEMTKKLAHCFREAFDLGPAEVAINRPFSGGYITRTYGQNPLPWIQIEMNRRLYLSPPWFNQQGLSVTKQRLEELNRSFEAALRLFFS
jgi:N-formylglutamate deformylase